MSKDMSVPCDNGIINIRVGAIIIKDGKILMAGNRSVSHLYSVGGRLKFGETSEQAIIREVYEETGIKMEIDRLAFVHENYFTGGSATKGGKLVYEISFFFLMKTPENFAPVCYSFTDDGGQEFLRWITPDTEETIYPEFFRTELFPPPSAVRHIVTREA